MSAIQLWEIDPATIPSADAGAGFVFLNQAGQLCKKTSAGVVVVLGGGGEGEGGTAGPAGPAGPAGAVGPAGPAGVQGVPGVGGGGGASVFGGPVVPVVLSPDDGQVNARRVFRLADYLHLGGVGQYCAQVQIADDVGFSVAAEVTPLALSNGAAVGLNEDYGGALKFWRARWVDVFGQVSGWTAARSVKFSRLVRMLGMGRAGNTSADVKTVSLGGVLSGGFLVAAVVHIGPLVPAQGWSVLHVGTVGGVTLTVMYAAVVPGLDSVTVPGAYSVILCAVSARPGAVSVNTMASGVAAAALGDVGGACLLIGFDRNEGSTHSFSDGVALNYGATGEGCGSYFLPVLALSDQCIGVQWARNVTTYDASVVAIELGVV